MYGALSKQVYLGINNEGALKRISGVEGTRVNVVLIDWNLVDTYSRPEDAYSYSLEAGGYSSEKFTVESLKTVYSGLEGFKILKRDNRWVLYAVFSDYSIPFYLLGDGFKSAFIYVSLLSSIKDGIVLAEEPEIHQHPSSLEAVAEAIVMSCQKHENQVFVTTHSLEFIDIVFSKAQKYSMNNRLAVYRLYFEENELKYRRYSLEDSLRLREDLEYDLGG